MIISQLKSLTQKTEADKFLADKQTKKLLKVIKKNVDKGVFMNLINSIYVSVNTRSEFKEQWEDRLNGMAFGYGYFGGLK